MDPSFSVITPLQHTVQSTVEYLAAQWPGHVPDVVLILGSGLGTVVDQWPLANRCRVPYHSIPHFPVSTVVGHASELVLGQWRPAEGPPLAHPLNIAILKGRFHGYEGYTPQEVVYPLRVLKAWGAKRLIVTNAAGGLDPAFSPGDWMLISDQLNLTGTNPLIGPNEDWLGPRFFDMGDPFCTPWRTAVAQAAEAAALTLRHGVYAGLSGPAYETHAEVRMLRLLGGSAVGMSTVAEVLAARHMGMQVVGLSCITNAAAGVGQSVVSGSEAVVLNHQEVVATGSNPAVLNTGRQLLEAALHWAGITPHQ
jgi:purine-nucleoside phosphorylase